MSCSQRFRRLAISITLVALPGVSLAAQEPAADAAAESAQLAVAAIEVEPSEPGPDTLCRLRVTIRNDGDRQASQLGFSVRLNGEELAVYGNQLFMYAVPPGGELEIPLYNFWTTETSRPTMPADGKFTVEVTLLEAQWMDISMEKETVTRGGEQVEEEVEVWTPLGAVDGLPVGASVTLDTTAGG